MTNNINLTHYQEFVNAVTSKTSTDLKMFIDRITELSQSGINVPLLITGYTGMAAEAGEFTEVPKKIIFQGKQLDDAALFHMKRELGDIIFYWIMSCTALGIDPNEVIAENVRKLESRYPNGFTVQDSEVRKDGDI